MEWRRAAAPAVLALALLLLPGPVHGGRTRNYTLFRVTPRNYTTPDNMNLGDAAGDTYFAFIKLGTPAQCRGSSFGPCSPSTNIPGFNVFKQFVIEADVRLGPYAQCNPDPSTGVYNCSHWFGSKGCWYNDTDHPEWATDFADICSADECECHRLQHEVMGREVINQTSPFPQAPPGWPQECNEAMQPVGNVIFPDTLAPVRKRIQIDEGGCCATCDSMMWPKVPWSEACVITTYYANTSTCELRGYKQPGHGRPPDPTPMPGAFSAYREPSASPATKVVQQSYTYMGRTMMPGSWFSTPSAGHCKEGQEIGRDCWWRLVGTGRTVNASCVDDRISESVVKRNQSCFARCKDPLDKASDCWIKCFFDIVVGNNGKPGITRAEAMEPFESAFLDPSVGGCPDVADCPEPCLPPCWAVAKGSPCTNETLALPGAGGGRPAVAEILV